MLSTQNPYQPQPPSQMGGEKNVDPDYHLHNPQIQELLTVPSYWGEFLPKLWHHASQGEKLAWA